MNTKQRQLAHIRESYARRLRQDEISQCSLIDMIMRCPDDAGTRQMIKEYLNGGTPEPMRVFGEEDFEE